MLKFITLELESVWGNGLRTTSQYLFALTTTATEAMALPFTQDEKGLNVTSETKLNS